MEIIPYCSATYKDRFLYMGYLADPPVVWSVTAPDMDAESGTKKDGAALAKTLGELYGHPIPQNQGICISADYTALSATYPNIIEFVQTFPSVTQWTSPENGTMGLLLTPSTSPSGTMATQAGQFFTTLPGLRFTIKSTGEITSPTNDYGLAINLTPYLRLLVSMQNAPCIQQWDMQTQNASQQFTTGWNTVAMIADVANVQHHLITHNNEIVIDVLPIQDDNAILVRMNDNTPMLWAYDPYSQDWGYTGDNNPDGSGPPPGANNLDGLYINPFASPLISFLLYSSNWATVEMSTLKYAPIVLDKLPLNIGRPHPNADQMAVVINALSGGKSMLQKSSKPAATGSQNYTVENKFTTKKIGYKLTVSRDDGIPPRLRDATAIIPAHWKYVSPTTTWSGDSTRFRIMSYTETSKFDDINRVITTSGMLKINNYDSYYTGIGGTFMIDRYMALNINQFELYKRVGGIAGHLPGGWSGYGSGPNSYIETEYQDMLSVLDVALSIEVICDGWYVYSAVRYLCEAASLHPYFLRNLPKYIPPGAPKNAPYGPAGTDVPDTGYVLGRGTGLNPRYRFTPEMTARQCLMQILRDLGTPDLINGRVIPWYMEWMPDDTLFFGPYDPLQAGILATFIDHSYDVNKMKDDNVFELIGQIEISNDVSNLRTEVVFEGRNAFTNELMVERLTAPDYVISWKGQRSAWVERSGRWATKPYLQQVAQNALVKATIPVQMIRWQSVAVPWLRAGNVVTVSENTRLGGTYQFIITEMEFEIGADAEGRALFLASYTGRNVLAYY